MSLRLIANVMPMISTGVHLVFELIGQTKAEQGMFLLGCVLGFMIAYWIHSKGVNGAGLASVISAVLGVSIITYLFEHGLLWGYGAGVFAGFVTNLVIRGFGFIIGGKAREATKKLSYNPDIKLTNEIIKHYNRLGDIFNQIYERGGGRHGLPELARIDRNEEEEFRELINWLSEKYPRIAGDTRRALRTVYYNRLAELHVDDYDPILQIIQTSSLRDVMSIVRVESFKRDWEAGRARLLAYLGLLKHE